LETPPFPPGEGGTRTLFAKSREHLLARPCGMVARALALFALGAAPCVSAVRAGSLGARSAAQATLQANASASTRASHPNLEKARAECAAITECYCIRQTPCGWCGSLGKGMLGTDDGPFDAEHCPDWVSWPDNCPTFRCSQGEQAELLWYLQCGWLPVLCFVQWLVVYIWRETLKVKHLSGPQLEALAFEVGDMLSQNTADSEGGPSDAAISYCRQQLLDMFGRKRTFEGFKKGLQCPSEERLKEGAARPYELNLSDLSVAPGEKIDTARVGPHRFQATLQVALQWRTALGASLATATGLMLLSSLYLALLRTAAREMSKDDYMWLAGVTQDLSSVAGPLQKAVSMLLSFYALDRIAWYWKVLMEGFVIQGRSHDLGMIGGVINTGTDTAWWQCYRLYRYVTINFFFTYQPYTPGLTIVGYGPLVKCGLIEPDEVVVLKTAHRGAQSITEGWISNWVAENLGGEARQQAFQALRELRNATTVTQALVEQRAPLSFESLLYLVTYCLVAIIPFAPSNIECSNRRAVMEGLHLATVFGDGIICAFYISLLHMLRHLQSPFDDIGAPHDALNPVAIMNSTERKLRDYLSAPDPHEVLAKGAAKQQESQ